MYLKRKWEYVNRMWQGHANGFIHRPLVDLHITIRCLSTGFLSNVRYLSKLVLRPVFLNFTVTHNNATNDMNEPRVETSMSESVNKALTSSPYPERRRQSSIQAAWLCLDQAQAAKQRPSEICFCEVCTIKSLAAKYLYIQRDSRATMTSW